MQTRKLRAFAVLSAFVTFLLIAPGGLLAQEAPPPPAPTAPSTAATSSQATSSSATKAVAYDTQPLPADPAAALELIGKANGLGSDELKPWYLKAHYQSFDAKGNPATQGSIEIWRAAKNDYRVTYTSDAFTQTYYETPDGSLRTGNSATVPYPESLIWDAIMRPADTFREKNDPRRNDRKIGKIEMTCLELPPRNAPVPDAFCSEKEHQSTLRLSQRSGYEVFFNKMELFQHRFVGGDVSIFDFHQPALKYSVDTLRALNVADRSLLTPPVGSTLDSVASDPALGGPSPSVKSTVLAGHAVSKTQPSYPAEAKQRRMQGTVRIQATIGKDGTVLNPMVVRDPDAALSYAAVKAVSQWRYSPYLLNGVPVEVHTTITVTFTLGG